MFAWISGFDNIHRIGTSQVVNMEKIISFSQKIKGIISIGLKSFTPINNLPPVSVENSPLSIFFAEGLLEPFSNAVNIITVHLSSDLKIVVTEDYFLFISWKQNCLILFSNYSKIERIFSIFKGYSWGGNGESKVAQRIRRKNSRLRNFKSFIIKISYFEKEVIES